MTARRSRLRRGRRWLLVVVVVVVIRAVGGYEVAYAPHAAARVVHVRLGGERGSVVSMRVACRYRFCCRIRRRVTTT